MLGILPLFFIGRYYFQLAHEYNRSRWGFAFLGIGIALMTQVVFGFLLGIIAAITGNIGMLDNTVILSIVALVLSVGVTVLVYKMLEKSWKKKVNSATNINLLDEDGYMKN